MHYLLGILLLVGCGDFNGDVYIGKDSKGSSTEVSTETTKDTSSVVSTAAKRNASLTKVSNGMTRAEVKVVLGEPVRVEDDSAGFFWVYEDEQNHPKFCYEHNFFPKNECKIEFSGEVMVGQEDFLAKWLDIMALDLQE